MGRLVDTLTYKVFLSIQNRICDRTQELKELARKKSGLDLYNKSLFLSPLKIKQIQGIYSRHQKDLINAIAFDLMSSEHNIIPRLKDIHKKRPKGMYYELMLELEKFLSKIVTPIGYIDNNTRKILQTDNANEVKELLELEKRYLDEINNYEKKFNDDISRKFKEITKKYKTRYNRKFFSITNKNLAKSNKAGFSEINLISSLFMIITVSSMLTMFATNVFTEKPSVKNLKQAGIEMVDYSYDQSKSFLKKKFNEFKSNQVAKRKSQKGTSVKNTVTIGIPKFNFRDNIVIVDQTMERSPELVALEELENNNKFSSNAKSPIEYFERESLPFVNSFHIQRLRIMLRYGDIPNKDLTYKEMVVAKSIYDEARGEWLIGKFYVASAILNKSYLTKLSIDKQCKAPNFCEGWNRGELPIGKGEAWEWSKRIARLVCKGYNTDTHGYTNFMNYNTVSKRVRSGRRKYFPEFYYVSVREYRGDGKWDASVSTRRARKDFVIVQNHRFYVPDKVFGFNTILAKNLR